MQVRIYIFRSTLESGSPRHDAYARTASRQKLPRRCTAAVRVEREVLLDVKQNPSTKQRMEKMGKTAAEAEGVPDDKVDLVDQASC